MTARYWNASLKGSCAKNDDSEGITLESLGGVFIATFVGLGELEAEFEKVVRACRWALFAPRKLVSKVFCFNLIVFI